VGTRPDCLGPEVLDLLAEYAARTHFWLEVGLQSAVDRTLRRVNRGHTVADFCAAVRAARARGLRVAAHVILGLPGEDEREMLSSADLLGELGVEGVKLHHLHVIRGTPMEQELRRGAVTPLAFPAYRELAIRWLERLPPEVVVFRLFGEAPDAMLVAPRWAESPAEARRLIEDAMVARGTRQGAAWRGAASARP